MSRGLACFRVCLGSVPNWTVACIEIRSYNFPSATVKKTLISAWRRRGDSNSCAPKVRRFSRPLGYRLPISSAVDYRAGVEPAKAILQTALWPIEFRELVGLERFELSRATAFETDGCAIRLRHRPKLKTLVAPLGFEPRRPKAQPSVSK